MRTEMIWSIAGRQQRAVAVLNFPITAPARAPFVREPIRHPDHRLGREVICLCLVLCPGNIFDPMLLREVFNRLKDIEQLYARSPFLFDRFRSRII